MKKLVLLILSIALYLNIQAQSPNSFKYQTVVRDAAGEVLPNQDISFQISILQGSATGSSVYSETHNVITNDFGLVNLNIGSGTTTDDFSAINWSNGPFFIKIELDENGGTAFSEMGTSQLLSVPYAMYANDVANKNDADADPNNEMQILNFSNDTLYLDNGGQVYLGDYSSLWGQNDTNIYYNNGWVGVGTSTPSGMMVVQGDEGVNPDSAIFEVKNKDGQTIFAVYDGGVRIWVDDTEAKSNTDKGGFAVGGYRLNKSITSEYLRVTPDSVRVYIREDDGTKSNTDKGGFAVGGYRLNKSTTSEYFNINPNEDADTLNPSEARIYWYPLKEAFMSGRVLVESVDSVGQNSWATGFESKSIGDYSQAMGYRARAKGHNSTAIGYYANADSANSYAFGNYALAQDSGSYAIGTGAKALGLRSFALGSVGVDSAGIGTNPTIATADYSYAFGMGSVASQKGAIAFGIQDTASGYYSLAMGYRTKASAFYSTTIGYKTRALNQYSTAIGELTEASGGVAFAAGYKSVASGEVAVALGYQDTASGYAATAMGYFTVASGTFSTAMGYKTKSMGDYSTSLGELTEASGGVAFAAGYNSIASGQVAVAIGYQDTASGYAATALGYKTKSIGNYSTSLGELTEASGAVAFAAGYKSVASGEVAVALGRITSSTGYASTSFGQETRASGGASTAMGYKTNAMGNSSFALGIGTVAKSYYSLAIGRYNDTLINSNMIYSVSSDPVFVIGNGSSETNRHNSFTVLKSGDMFLTKLNNDTDIIRFRVSGSAYDIDFFNHNLYFSGYDASTQLVAMMIEYDSGNVGIGTTSPDKKLTVNGDARVTGSIFYGASGSTTTYNKPDFVFKPNYKGNYDIFEIENFINKNGHLPWVTAAKDEKNGINMTKMSFQTLEAVENQQLQIIELKKENKEQQEIINELIKRIEKLENKK